MKIIFLFLGVLLFGTKARHYSLKKEGIFDETNGYFILKRPKISKSWKINNGIASFINSKNQNVLIVKELFSQKGYFTKSYYELNKGLVKYEVFSIENNKEHNISSMVIKSYICSDI